MGKKVKLHCNAKGLEMAIEDALSQMEETGADGFDYVIGEVRGMKLRIVAENNGKGVFDTIEVSGPLTYTAVAEE